MSDIIAKTFYYDGHYYVYDANLNILCEIKKEHYLTINRFMKTGFPPVEIINEMSEFEKDILMLKTRGMFASDIISDVKNPYDEYIDNLLEGAINDITLQVTRKCNFDCRYCLYAGEEGIERTHEKRSMSLDVAYKCVDFLYEHSYDSKKLSISFYGGEPLINFELIKNIVEYCDKTFYTKLVHYSLTTNGSLINKEIIEFFKEHDFDISISLDGPQKVQDIHRRFRETYEGTYERVYRNVMMIKDKYYDYFRNHITFVPVVIDDENFETVTDFYKQIGIEYKQIIPIKANLNGIDYRLSNRDKIHNSSLKFIDLDSTGINDNVFKNMNTLYNNRKPLPKIWHHNGQCIPGVHRLFVDCDGIFYPCEKILENPTMRIGSIWNGFDIPNIKSMLSIGKLTENRCKKCWAVRFCEICAALCIDIDNQSLSSDVKEKVCRVQENNALWFFKKLIKSMRT